MRLNESIIKKYLYESKFGLEMESLRVDGRGRLAQTAHPFKNDPNIIRDFCENQVEIKTDVKTGPHEVIEELVRLHRKVAGKLVRLKTGSEYLWPFSNPPFISGEDEIPVARFEGNLKHEEEYRHYLADKYGKVKMLFSGTHCNFSFSDELINEGFLQSGYGKLADYKNDVYLFLAKKIMKYSWLIVYLTAASPVADKSFMAGLDPDFKEGNSVFASIRCSRLGYWNNFVPVFSYSDIKSYVAGIQRYIDEGKLTSVSELYYPVRLKPAGENSLENLIKNGVDHIELRMLDINPLAETGIFEEDLSFIMILIMYLMMLGEESFEAKEQTDSVSNMKNAAMFNDEEIMICYGNKTENIKEAALLLLNDIKKFCISVHLYDEAMKILDFQIDKIINPQKRYVNIIKKHFENDYNKKGLEYAIKGWDQI